MNKTTFRKPASFRIDSSERKLYKLENQLSDTIRELGTEWARIALEHSIINEDQAKSFFRVQLPQVLFDLMGSYETEAGKLACEAFLEKCKAEGT